MVFSFCAFLDVDLISWISRSRLFPITVTLSCTRCYEGLDLVSKFRVCDYLVLSCLVFVISISFMLGFIFYTSSSPFSSFYSSFVMYSTVSIFYLAGLANDQIQLQEGCQNESLKTGFAFSEIQCRLGLVGTWLGV